jgi:GxxExxY protein
MTNESLNYDVIGCAMKVHRILGTGFIESVYQRCLEIEFKLAGIPYEKEKHLTVYYWVFRSKVSHRFRSKVSHWVVQNSGAK